MSPLAKKLHLKPDYRILVLRAPKGFSDLLEPLPEAATVVRTSKQPCDAALLFVGFKADADEHFATAIESLKDGGLLWVAYPKKTSKVKTDITRDQGWNVAAEAGWQAVAMVSIDDTWSAMRFRPSSQVGA